METVNERLTAWIIQRIETEYKDDIGLLIGDDVLKLDKDRVDKAMGFYFPASEKANKLARTFIIDGIGYDLFPMSWERLENIANLDEDNAPVLLDAVILYSPSENDKKQFISLQDKLRRNLADGEYTYKKALEKLGVAMELYQTMSFEDSLYRVRKAAGYIVIYLSNAVAYINHTYFRRGHNEQIRELLNMKSLPDDFVKLIKDIIAAGSGQDAKQKCYQLIRSTRQFLSDKQTREMPVYKQNYQDLADWYHELSYAWREIYHWCDHGDAVKAFIRGCFLQSELDIIAEEFGLGEFDLLGSFDVNNLDTYHARAGEFEKRIISVIKANGALIDSYDSVDEFVTKNS